ncbi:MAG: preprotein translocase subunit SecG [Planctomycetota bacterium]
MQLLDTTFTASTILARGEAPGAMIWLMALGFTFICLFMMVVILIQKPKGGGLSGAFGGGAGGGSAGDFIGGGVGNVLTAVTVVCFLVFLLLAGTMTLAINAGDDPAKEPEQAETLDGAAPSDTDDPDTGPATTPETTPDETTKEETTEEEPAEEEPAEDEPAEEAATEDETPAPDDEPTDAAE